MNVFVRVKLSDVEVRRKDNSTSTVRHPCFKSL